MLFRSRPIGKSISSEIAEIYMEWFERMFVYPLVERHQVKLWKRMRDDVFLIWSDTGQLRNDEEQHTDNLDPLVLRSTKLHQEFSLQNCN